MSPTSAILQKLSFSRSQFDSKAFLWDLLFFQIVSSTPVHISRRSSAQSRYNIDINQLFRSFIMNVMTPNVESIVWFLCPPSISQSARLAMILKLICLSYPGGPIVHHIYAIASGATGQKLVIHGGNGLLIS